MQIYTFPLGQIDTNSYLIFPDNSDEAILVDAPLDASLEIPQFLKDHNRKLAAILLTHGHWDHIWDTAKLAKATGAKVYAGESGRELIENPEFQRQHLYAGEGLEPIKIDYMPKDGETIEVAGVKILCLEAPGHCPGSIMYYLKDDADDKTGRLFAGDVIFADSIGRADLWGGSFSTLQKSIKEKVYTLPDDTFILCGHGEPTDVGYEKKNNPYVRG